MNSDVQPATKMTTPEVLAEVSWLMEAELHPEHVAKQLGRTMASLEKLARTHGELDIAREFRKAIRHTERAA